MKLNRMTASAVATLALFASFVAVPAGATSLSTSNESSEINETEQAVRDFFTENGVPQDTQEDLLDKRSQGERWDSMKLDSVPVDVETVVEGRFEKTVKRYADGSVEVVSMEIPFEIVEGAPLPRGIVGCVATLANSYQMNYEGCEIEIQVAPITMAFTSDYTHFKGGPSRINKVYDEYAQVIGGTMKGHSLSITRKNQSGSLPATARYKMQATYEWKGVSVVDSHAWIEFRVLGGVRSTRDFM